MVGRHQLVCEEIICSFWWIAIKLGIPDQQKCRLAWNTLKRVQYLQNYMPLDIHVHLSLYAAASPSLAKAVVLWGLLIEYSSQRLITEVSCPKSLLLKYCLQIFCFYFAFLNFQKLQVVNVIGGFGLFFLFCFVMVSFIVNHYSTARIAPNFWKCQLYG